MLDRLWLSCLFKFVLFVRPGRVESSPPLSPKSPAVLPLRDRVGIFERPFVAFDALLVELGCWGFCAELNLRSSNGGEGSGDA